MISTNGCDLPFYGLGFVDIKGKCLDIKLESFSSVTWEDWRLFLTYVTILTNLGNSFTFSGRFIPPLCDFPSRLLWMCVETHLNIFSLGDIMVIGLEFVHSPPFLTLVRF